MKRLRWTGGAAGRSMYVATWPSGEEGSAPTIVLIHGVGVSSRYFAPLARRLSPHLTVLAPDLPGFGSSPGPASVLDIAQLAAATGACLRDRGIANAIVVGHSLGAQVAIELALESHGLVAGVVLIGPTTDRDAAWVHAQLFRLLSDLPREQASTFALTAPDYVRAGLRRIVATMEHAVRHRMLARAATVLAPALIIRGGGDPVAPRRWVDTLSRAMPNAYGVLTIPRGAHAVHVSHVDAVAEGILATVHFP